MEKKQFEILIKLLLLIYSAVIKNKHDAQTLMDDLEDDIKKLHDQA